MSEELKIVFKYLLDFAKHPEQYNDDMIALLKVEQVIELLNYIDILNNQLQQKENIIKEARKKLINSKKYKAVKSLDFNSKMSVLIELEEILDKGE